MLFQTERLEIREFVLQDAKFILELLNTPGWLKYIGDRHIKTLEDAQLYLQNGPLKSYNLNGFGLYMVVLKDNHCPIGMCGLVKRDYLESVDIGFAFLPQYAGKGYAYEASLAIINYSFKVLEFNKVLAITLPINSTSIQLIEKLNFSFVKSFKDNGEDLLLYEFKQ